MSGLTPLLAKESSPSLIPDQYQHLLAVYAASRCFAQDERNYQATTLMNEFEVKLEEFNSRIEDGRIIITDPTTGNPVTVATIVDYVDLSAYWDDAITDLDEGVEGVGS